MEKEDKIKAMEKMLGEADMVLVGIGEDFEEGTYLNRQPAYQKICEQIADAKAQWVMPYVNHIFLEQDEKLERAYRNLAGMLQDKNYYIISVSTNGILSKSSLCEDRIVEPCGSFYNMQCSNGCLSSVKPVHHVLLEEVEQCCKGEKDWNEMKGPACSLCGAPMEYNSLYAEHYLEEGYQDKWNAYTKWLQNTVNKRLCILELGAGMMFAGVLRFRFEKILGINRKAEMVRVHQNLYQFPEEVGKRGVGISQNAVDFMAGFFKI